MSALQPAQPQYGKTVSLAVGTTAAFVNLPPQGVAGGTMQVDILNSGPNVVFVRVSNSASGSFPASATSPNADYAIGPNSNVVITKGIDDNVVSAIAAATGNTIWVTCVTGW